MPASSALRVLEALRRRGLAYVFGQAVTWAEYDRYLTKLFAHMSRDPPPGFNRVSVSQTVEADRQVFVRMIEANVQPCKISSGVLSMDDALMRALESYEVSFVLMHSPSSRTDHCISAFFYLRGWGFSSEGEKDMEFSQIFTALGVTIDLSACLDGRLRIANTAKRVAEVLEFISRILEEGALPTPLALKLRGRLQFADGQLLGRVGKSCLKTITEHAYSNKGPKLSDQCKAALSRFADMLKHSLPRMVLAHRQEPLYMFTDASYEPSSATWPCGIGGVLFNAEGKPIGAFSSPVSCSLERQLGEDSKRTIIFEAELTAILCGLILWAEQLSHSPVVVYVDNNSAGDIAISQLTTSWMFFSASRCKPE